METHERLKQLRAERGQSQREIGAALGIHFSTVNKIETGRMRLSAERMVRLAEHFGVSLSAFEGEDDVDPLPGLAERVKMRLAELGMSQATLARLIGISPPAVQQLCNGTTQSTRYILEIASALGCDANWLRTGEEASVLEINGIPQPSSVLVNGIKYVLER